MTIRTVQGVVLGVAVGVTIGVSAYTFAYARGWAYMTDKPEACTNCHVMNEEFTGWIKSSHRSVAVCNDCHTPPSFVGKYLTKAKNGFWHSYYFTTGRFQDNIQITEPSRNILEQACRKCHQEITDAIEGTHSERDGDRLSCLRCHSSVGHLK